MADVFISYKREERDQVAQLAEALRALKLVVWFDASLSAGEAFSDEIDREARAARTILVCWSPTARESKWVKAEAEIGFTQDKLAAAYVAGPDGFAAPVPFNTIHAEDLRAWLASPHDTHSGWRSLLRRVGRLCERKDLESWGALDSQAAAGELRAWLNEHHQSPLFVTVQMMLEQREREDGERTRLEQKAREEWTRKEAERKAREAEATERQKIFEAEQAQRQRILEAERAQRGDSSKDILGHPRGLWYLSFAEAWERFSYYGMNALLVLYLTQYLLLPEHVAQVAGFGPFKAGLERAYGPLATPIALATAITGVYTSGVYITPIIGGLIADHLLGRTRTVALGALLMVFGHFLMAFEVSFVAAIICLFVGVGCFKGNIASQVGELYGPTDLRRADAYQVYMLGIQLAVIVAPLVCGTLGEKVAWHWGFGAAGVGMTLGLIIYLSGRKYLPPEPPRGARAKAAAGDRAPLKLRDWLVVLVLVAMLPALALSALGNQQIFNVYEVWGEGHYDRNLFGFNLPVTWLLSVDAFFSTFTMLGVIAFWRWYSKTRREPDEIVKILIGTVISACGPLLLAAGSAEEVATGQKVSLLWGIGFHIVNDLGFAMVFPVGLALFSRASPKGLGGMIIGFYYLHLAMANLGTGVLGGMYENMSGAQFWLMHTGLVLSGGAILLVFALLFHRILAPTAEAKAT